MKKLRTVSIVILAFAIAGFIACRFTVPFPDWLVRINGVLMLAAAFTFAFSSVKLAMSRK